MENNVVYSLFQLFASQGFSTLRFNFRGCGKSGGRTSFKGNGEKEDLIAIYNYLNRVYSFKSYILTGYSYGSIAACASIPEISNIIGIVSISYPAGVSWALTFWNASKYEESLACAHGIPKLFILGDKDNFTSVSTFQSFCKKIAEPKTVLIVKDVNHFWNDVFPFSLLK